MFVSELKPPHSGVLLHKAATITKIMYSDGNGGADHEYPFHDG